MYCLHVSDLPTDVQVSCLINSILIVMFMYSYCYVCFVLYILPLLRFFRAFSSVVRQMPGYNSQRRGTARTLPVIVFFNVLLNVNDYL